MANKFKYEMKLGFRVQ